MKRNYGVHILGTLQALWIMRSDDLDEQRAADTHAALALRKQGQGADVMSAP